MTVPQQERRWRKAARSQNEGACIELAYDGEVRDSKNTAGPTLVGVDLGAMLAVVKTGQFG